MEIALVVMTLIITIFLFFFCWVYAELLCSYNTPKNTQMEKVTPNSGACMQDLPPAYEDIYRL